jgi:ABC-type Na+ efflux pump permease subunit
MDHPYNNKSAVLSKVFLIIAVVGLIGISLLYVYFLYDAISTGSMTLCSKGGSCYHVNHHERPVSFTISIVFFIALYLFLAAMLYRMFTYSSSRRR